IPEDRITDIMERMKKWKVAVAHGYRYLGNVQNGGLSTVENAEITALGVSWVPCWTIVEIAVEHLLIVLCHYSMFKNYQIVCLPFFALRFRGVYLLSFARRFRAVRFIVERAC